MYNIDLLPRTNYRCSNSGGWLSLFLPFRVRVYYVLGMLSQLWQLTHSSLFCWPPLCLILTINSMYSPFYAVKIVLIQHNGTEKTIHPLRFSEKQRKRKLASVISSESSRFASTLFVTTLRRHHVVFERGGAAPSSSTAHLKFSCSSLASTVFLSMYCKNNG